MSKRIEYPFEIRPLTLDEGGGYLISYPDFSDCLADGETVEEAVANGKAALRAAIAALKAKDRAVPQPNSGGVASGKFVARVPKTVHARLATRAKAEGVSLNTLVLTFIAEGLGRKESRPLNESRPLGGDRLVDLAVVHLANRPAVEQHLETQ